MPANLPVTDLEDERIFLERLIEPSNREPVQTFWQLVRFYRLAEKNDLASTLIFHMVEAHDSVENKAYCYLALGQIAEVRGQYDAAVDLYTRGLTFRTPDTTVRYFLYNNTTRRASMGQGTAACGGDNGARLSKVFGITH
jgi:tetratricopeptide (TPR) repeat protein